MVIQLGSILHGTCIVLRAISKASVSSLKTSVDAELVILYASFAYKAIFKNSMCVLHSSSETFPKR